MARWAIDILGIAFGISPYGRRLVAEGMRGADTEGRGHSRQRGAKGDQRTQGMGGGIGEATQRGRGGRAADAPQGPCRPRKPHPHPTRLHPTPSLADILLSCDRPLSKIISQKLNQRMGYHLCVWQCGLQYTQRGFMYSGVYTKVLLCSWYDGLPHPPRIDSF